jgi:hypothetical protein
LVPVFVAAISFMGGLAGNLIAGDLQTALQPYRRWVWLSGAIALAVAMLTAFVEARRRSTSPGSSTNEKSGGITALNQLRPPVGDFVGREQQIKAVFKTVRDRGRACISGMGGMGKTELALLVAQRLARDYPDAQFFINLQGTDPNPRCPEEVMGMYVRSFRGPKTRVPEDFDELSQLYRSELSGKRALLLLDDATDSAQVLPLLPPTGSALLVTSRQGIALPGLTSLTLGMTYAVSSMYILQLRQPSREQIRWLEIALDAARRLKDRAHEGYRSGVWRPQRRRHCFG